MICSGDVLTNIYKTENNCNGYVIYKHTRHISIQMVIYRGIFIYDIVGERIITIKLNFPLLYMYFYITLQQNNNVIKFMPTFVLSF